MNLKFNLKDINMKEGKSKREKVIKYILKNSH